MDSLSHPRRWPRLTFLVLPLVCLAAVALLPRLAIAAPDLALQMSVDTPIPAPGQPVEFKLTVSNVGADSATGVVVNDKLPAELVIPTGLAAFPSAGTYDPASGAWTIGTLNAGASAILVIPTILAVSTAPPCVANVATTNNSLDPRSTNDRAVAVVRRDAAVRCVDLWVTASNMLLIDCGHSMQLAYWVTVRNAGPDDATVVFLDLSQSPAIAPNLRFTGLGCSGTRCTIASIPAGATHSVEAVSDSFPNNRDRSVQLLFAVSSNDTDFLTSNSQYAVDRELPALPPCPDYPDEGWGVVATGCFIATAAYGSPLEPHVVALRQFRDRHLQRTAMGRGFIRWYYRFSPPVAAVVARHEWLRSGTRALLTPIVLAIEFPFRALILSMTLIAALALHARVTAAPASRL